MSEHLAWETLVAYWVDEHPDPDTVEAHAMGCAECTQLSARVAALTQALSTLMPPLLTPAVVAKLAGRGLRVGENPMQPGERREVVFPADLDVLIHRLEGVPDDLVRLDFAMHVEGTRATLAQLEDVPFADGSALLACQQHYASLPPDVVVTLHGTHRDGHRSETHYTILHRFERTR